MHVPYSMQSATTGLNQLQHTQTCRDTHTHTHRRSLLVQYKRPQHPLGPEVLAHMTLMEPLPIPTLLHATRQSLYTAMSRSVAAAGRSVAQQQGRMLIPRTEASDCKAPAGHGALPWGCNTKKEGCCHYLPAQRHPPR